MWTPEERARIEALESLIERGRASAVSVATASGTIDALGVVTINHKTANISSIVANTGAGTLTVNFGNIFDVEGVYFMVGFIYDPAVGTSPFLPITQTPVQTVLSGVYPPPGPWAFAIFAIANA